ncbi:MAG TPA: decaprenyl-phosphate phosphoribosyltransferase [bacterium]|nr:decaprenyl-phosphate phosphoribosyltransferase [bacterium]HOX86410.1 decaprenyl-phosphate phosphoribosyltransferase [bacterium]HPG45761.1 decaprenyl-phosphate phosphoribosyltransferase [bacterium]HPM98012.1 decaprenyl-phosphate phosphoribosyltransferase [bacterium]
MFLIHFIRALRPYQWSKNLLVFAALIFSERFLHPADLLLTCLAFLFFCLTSGWVYVVNDVRDREADRLHPVKRLRPLASGDLKPAPALILATLLLLLGIVCSIRISPLLSLALVLYALMNLAYTFGLKNIVILDILLIAVGFVLRAVAGAWAIDVPISHWLLVCTFFLALFLVIGKRRNELVKLGDHAAGHRPILHEYNEAILDQMIGVVTAATIIAYALYTVDGETVAKFGTDNLIYTIPFVVYGIFRYFYLIYKRQLGDAPEKILIRDRYILATVFLWLGMVIFILYG